MRSFVLIALAAALSAPAAGVATAQTRSRTFDVLPNQAQLFPLSVECESGEEVVGGGFSSASRELRVISSYPSSPTSWTVVVWNPSKTLAPLQVNVRCLRGADGHTSSQTVAGQPPSAQAQCPSGTVVTGGGYRSSWAPRTGGAVVTGSYPTAGNGWAVEAARLPGDAGGAPGTQKIEVFAVCLGGKASSSTLGAAVTQVEAGTPSCIAVPNFAQQCTFPRTASQKVTCAAGEVFSSSGYQVTSGTLPNYAVLTAGGEIFEVSGASRDNSAIAMRLTPVCLTWLAAPVPAPASLQWALPAGAAVLLLLLLAVFLVRSRSNRNKKPPGSTGLEVTVKSQRSAFRLDQLREVS
ncbi:hypothetical protein Rhe02_63170 [Rhizocola hellebori]|uniref:Uncharacterized protein n=1 Tax=Rhizocola hellebori TaxID=1392758 RepID=A0A8J3QCT0_9ACTN|nr:hypothetical protein [Rhizocola hellebori]GIH08250.1 hypothetical protein Rhe02_63170 [Rhizocola hellebori]